MTRVYIATTPQALEKAKHYGQQPCFAIDHPEAIEADEYVVVGEGAKAAMEQLRARGLAPHELSWFDGETETLRHYHWDLYGSAQEIENWRPGQYQRCGIDGLGKVLRWRQSELVITAGPYSGGKSLFTQILAQDYVRMTGEAASICAWEDSGPRIKAGLIRYRDTVMQTESDKIRDGFLGKFHIAKIDSSKDRYLSEYMELVRYLVKRFGVRYHVFDPWNEFDHQRHAKQNETEYVREVMKAFRRLVDELRIIMNITTHVGAEYIGNDGSIKPFRVAHSFGSSQFANKMDRGFCVMRTDKWAEEGESHMLVRQDKVKEEDQPGMEAMGKKATMLFKYHSPNNQIYYDGKMSAEESVQKIWRG